MSHYLKAVMDGIFGSNQSYQNEIIWSRVATAVKGNFGQEQPVGSLLTGDTIFY